MISPKYIILSLILLSCFSGYCQSFEVRLASSAAPLIIDPTDGTVKETADNAVPTLYVKTMAGAAAADVFKVFVAGTECGGFHGDGKIAAISCSTTGDLRDKSIQITNKDDKPIITFTIKSTSGGGGTIGGNGVNNAGGGSNGGGATRKTAAEKFKELFPKIAVTTFGLQVPSSNTNTVYTGKKYVHIFIDQYGNTIAGTIPQGISNLQYVVHVFFLQSVDNPTQTDYSVNQTLGEFDDAIVFNNSGQLNSFEFRGGDMTKYQWAHKEYLLSTSTSNIQFDINKVSPKSDLSSDVQSQTLKSYTIKMAKVYHGSFDIGLINSKLENPTFSLLTSPVDTTKQVVKKSGGGDRGIVTAMATFYTSPIILIESLLGLSDIPTYKLSSRCFLDDHKVYERIYPAIGVGFTDKTLQNLFFGFNWEFARGGAVFAGWHYGKVNVYNGSSGFEFGKTYVTSQEFDLENDTAWKTAFAFGVKMDIMIVANLFKQAGAK